MIIFTCRGRQSAEHHRYQAYIVLLDAHYLSYYFDRRLPKDLKLHDGRTIHVDDFLVVHEVTEKALMDKLGYTYPEAHLMAEAAERFACHRHGVPWDEYQSFCEYWIEATSNEYHDIPIDIDLKPEKDTKDVASLHKFLDIIKSKYSLKSLK